MKDPYTYDNGVLINKLGIKEHDKLNRAEADITFSRLLTAHTNDFSYKGILNLHKHIFSDLYDFAGKERTILMVKSEQVLGGDTVRYAYPRDIKLKSEEILKELNKTNWKKLELDAKICKFTNLTAALWKVHPFREGNTRTIVTFSTEFAKANGFEMDIKLLKDNAKYVRNSLVKASDGQYAEPKYLEKIFKDCVISCEHTIEDGLKRAGFKPTVKLITDVKELNKCFGKLHSVKEIKQLYNTKNELEPDQREIVEKTANDFKSQEKMKIQEFELDR